VGAVRTAEALRVGVLVDLAIGPAAGGHVRTWQRLARAAIGVAELDLTIHFSGAAEHTRFLGDNVRLRVHRPVFSTARLRFLGHIPDHTDLAPHHARLARHLARYHVLHTTEGTFAFARTAARVARRADLPLVNSVHTDTARYAGIFAASTLDRLLGAQGLARRVADRLRLADRAEAQMRARLEEHRRRCAFVLVSRPEDLAPTEALLGPRRVGLLRRGLDHALFSPDARDRGWLRDRFGVPEERVVVITVGRVDRGKRTLMLARALRALADAGRPVHLLCAGAGPDRAPIVQLLGDRATCPGVLDPPELARAYASSDLCAQASEVEELSNVVLEAQSAGLPVVVSAASGSQRLLQGGRTGLVVTGHEAGDWAASLGALVGDGARRGWMSRAAREWALRHVPSWRDVLMQDLLPVWSGVARRDRDAR
jgi:glycosyltransferase involved in cell wall biosynthesis